MAAERCKGIAKMTFHMSNNAKSSVSSKLHLVRVGPSLTSTARHSTGYRLQWSFTHPPVTLVGAGVGRVASIEIRMYLPLLLSLSSV
jgi:hypothetical protein